MGLDVENTAKCHSWPNGCCRPLIFFLTQHGHATFVPDTKGGACNMGEHVLDLVWCSQFHCYWWNSEINYKIKGAFEKKYFDFDLFCLLQFLQWSTADAEIKVPSLDKPGLMSALPFKPGVGWNIATHALPPARNFFLVLIFIRYFSGLRTGHCMILSAVNLMHVCVCVRVRARAWTTNMKCVRTHTCMCTCVFVCVHVNVYECMCMYVQGCVYECVWMVHSSRV